MKKWYESKTLWVAFLSGVIGVLAVLTSEHPEIGYLVIANSVITAILRALTTQPVAFK